MKLGIRLKMGLFIKKKMIEKKLVIVFVLLILASSLIVGGDRIVEPPRWFISDYDWDEGYIENNGSKKLELTNLGRIMIL